MSAHMYDVHTTEGTYTTTRRPPVSRFLFFYCLFVGHVRWDAGGWTLMLKDSKPIFTTTLCQRCHTVFGWEGKDEQQS